MISIQTTHYPIHLGQDLLSNSLPRLADDTQPLAIVSDSIVAPLWSEALQRALGREATHITIPAGESHKTLETTGHVWQQLVAAKFDRQGLVFNLGGGVVGDLGGFAASCYMRGIDFIQVPTTLLSQVDASVGGKTGIDFAGAKNIIGAFQMPKAVLIDVSTLRTLPMREISSGLAEVIKHALIFDASLLEFLTEQRTLEDVLNNALEIVRRSVEIKKTVVENDPKEKGQRKILNFGHTIGHAIEAALLDSPHRLLHGEAIALGMLAELSLGEALGVTPKGTRTRLEALLPQFKLPTVLPTPIADDQLLDLMRLDKKNSGGKISFSLISDVGTCIWDKYAEQSAISEAVKSLL